MKICSVAVWSKEDFFFLLLKEMNTFIQHGHIKLIKSDVKNIYNVTKACCFFSFIKESWIYHCLNKHIKQLNCFQL